jgi:hypothetical protein
VSEGTFADPMIEMLRSGARALLAPRLRQKSERDGAEQRSLRATRRQLDANARDMLDHARADLDQALVDGRELCPCEWVCLWNGGA